MYTVYTHKCMVLANPTYTYSSWIWIRVEGQDGSGLRVGSGLKDNAVLKNPGIGVSSNRDATPQHHLWNWG